MKLLRSLLLAGLACLLGTARGATDRLEKPAARYDQEYPVIDYSGPATHNRVWRLQQALDSGAIRLQWEPKWGYLRSLLMALQIETDSQVLVYSRTSLQFEQISALAPRAVYFNDDTYVGITQGTALIELAAIDAQKGPVFFVVDNREQAQMQLQREGNSCLSCHDTYSMMGGGIPRVLAMSAPVEDPADVRTAPSASEVDDRTPLAQRWGGWYLTGSTGKQTHFGNLPLRDSEHMERLRERRERRHDLATLQGYFDTSNYLSGQSDVVALLVLEHQTFIQNIITRIHYKLPAILARGDQKLLKSMMEPLVRALFFQDAAPFGDHIKGSSGFTARFATLGPRDSGGHGLHELDLSSRLLKNRLSYQIHSPQIDALPPIARDYLYQRIVEILQGRDTTGISASIPAEERQRIASILMETRPPLDRLLAAPTAGPRG